MLTFRSTFLALCISAFAQAESVSFIGVDLTTPMPITSLTLNTGNADIPGELIPITLPNRFISEEAFIAWTHSDEAAAVLIEPNIVAEPAVDWSADEVSSMDLAYLFGIPFGLAAFALPVRRLYARF